MAKVLSREEELQRVGRALRTLSGSNRALLRVSERQQLLQEICRVVVEEAGYRAATVVQAERNDQGRYAVLAQVGHDAAFEELRQRTWSVADDDHSATGIALRTGEPCLINDVQNSQQVADVWHEFHRRHGFGAVLSLPLRVGGELFGALTILAPEADAFDEFEREPLLEAAADLAFGLETLQAR
jgi:GAF domain-containing protein